MFAKTLHWPSDTFKLRIKLNGTCIVLYIHSWIVVSLGPFGLLGKWQVITSTPDKEQLKVPVSFISVVLSEDHDCFRQLHLQSQVLCPIPSICNFMVKTFVNKISLLLRCSFGWNNLLVFCSPLSVTGINMDFSPILHYVKVELKRKTSVLE